MRHPTPMRLLLSLSLAVAALGVVAVPGGLALPGGTELHLSMSGTCTTANRLDSNAVLLSTSVSCDTKATCTCAGRRMQLHYISSWKAPGNGGPGLERGTLVVMTATGSVTLLLRGTRTGIGASTGTWRLGNVSGSSRGALTRSGTYSSDTSPNGSALAPTTPAKVTATISCWACGSAG